MLSFSDSLPLPGSSPWVNEEGGGGGSWDLPAQGRQKSWGLLCGRLPPGLGLFSVMLPLHILPDLPWGYRPSSGGNRWDASLCPELSLRRISKHSTLRGSQDTSLAPSPPSSPKPLSHFHFLCQRFHQPQSSKPPWVLIPPGLILNVLTLRNKGHLECFKTIAWLTRLLSFTNAILSNRS